MARDARASLGALLLAGAAVGRGGLTALHFTSPARRPGRGAREAARGPRRRRGARVPRARGLRAASATPPSSPGARADAASEPIRRRRSASTSARAARSAGARARRARSRSRRRPSRETVPRTSGAAGDETVTTPSFVSGDDPSAPSYETRKVLDPLAWRMNIESEIAVVMEKAARAAAGAGRPPSRFRPK